MKVLHVEAGRHLYGGALQVLFLLQGLREADPAGRHLLVCAPESAVAASANQLQLPVRELALGGEADLGAVPRLARLARNEGADLLHAHSRRGADLWTGLAARLAGRPAVITRRVDNPEARALVALKYRCYRHVITISEGIRKVLLSEGVPAAKLSCVPSAVDTVRYRPGADRSALKAAFDIPDHAPVAGVIAQLIPRKGHQVLLEALPQVLAQQPRLQVLLFGRGPLEDELKRQVRSRGLDHSVRFAGFRDDLERLLPALDLVVHPALMEGLGVALLQASACAVPVVAARAGGIPEVVRDGENGRLVAPADATGLARAMLELLGDRDLARRMGARGRELVQDQFSIARMVAGNLAVYRMVLEG